MTEKDETDIEVVVIGAGVAGLYLSKILENKSINHVVLERNNYIGKNGNRIINKDVAKRLTLSDNEIIETIKEMSFFSPSEICIKKTGNEVRGFVTNIGLIEKHLYRTLSKKDNVKLNSRVEHIDLKNGIVRTSNNKLKARAIVFASGILQGSFLNLFNSKPSKNVFCFTVEIEANDSITTILDNELAHGFYGWIIPLERNRIELGFGTDILSEIRNANLAERLFSFPYLKKYKNEKILKIGGGFIPVSMTNKLSGKNWMLIGDASGGEPMMGGSIHKAVDDAELAADIIENLLNENKNSLTEFQSLWEKKIGGDIKRQEHMRKIINDSNNEKIDSVFSDIKNKNIDGDGLINDLFMNIIKGLEKRTKL